MSEPLQNTDFQSQVDRIFSIRLDDATTIDLQLVSVTELGAATGTATRAPFSLHFLGPVSQQYLQQHTYPMVNETLGTFDIFIVPLGAEAGRMRYEAIFT
ncbi:MAG TPA: hypothetical protein VN653_15295 [Anaerolineales bacterium]|jgi:hypothetical protein|nr:hypothetical protein [Anaerolineales bacterium]